MVDDSFDLAAIGAVLMTVGEQGVIEKDRLESGLVGMEGFDSTTDADKVIGLLHNMGLLKVEDGWCWVSPSCEEKYLEIGNSIPPQG